MINEEGFDTELTQQVNNRKGAYVSFDEFPEPDDVETARRGRQIFKDVEYIRIRIPGQRDEVHRPVNDVDRKIHERQYRAWKEGRDQDAASGTILSSVPWMTKGQVETARHSGIRTVEQLASVADVDLQNLGFGWLSLRQKAIDMLDAAKGLEPLSQARAENETLRSQVQALQRQMEELAEAVKPKRGRPAKPHEEATEG